MSNFKFSCKYFIILIFELKQHAVRNPFKSLLFLQLISTFNFSTKYFTMFKELFAQDNKKQFSPKKFF